MRFSAILVTYFVLGAVMWGSGFIAWDSAGVAEHVIDDPTDEQGGADDVRRGLENMGGPIGTAAGTLGGGLLAVWSFVSGVINFLFWPYTVLHDAGAPPEVSVLLGGGVCVAFIGSLIRTVRGTA